MSLYGAFDKRNNLSELTESDAYAPGGIKTAATRQLEALQNITGDSNITLADMTKLAGITATAAEINNLSDFAYVQLFDDFTGDALNAEWVPLSGTDAQALDPAIIAASRGILFLQSGDSNTNYAADASQLSGEVIWLPSQTLVIEARLYALTSVAARSWGFGFTDIKTLEAPFSINGTTITSNASNAVCFVHDTAATAGTVFHCLGVKADTDTALTSSGQVVAADTLYVLRIEIDASGQAVFKINGTTVATVADACTPGTLLSPIVWSDTNTTASKAVGIDYIYVRQVR